MIASIPVEQQTECQTIFRAPNFHRRVWNLNSIKLMDCRSAAGLKRAISPICAQRFDSIQLPASSAEFDDFGIVSGDYKAGAAELQNALPIERKLYEDFPSAPKYAFEYSKSLRDLAKMLREDQRFEEAEPFIDEAVAIQEKLVEEHPTDIQYQSGLIAW